jgi:hypothetical protein
VRKKTSASYIDQEKDESLTIRRVGDLLYIGFAGARAEDGEYSLGAWRADEMETWRVVPALCRALLGEMKSSTAKSTDAAGAVEIRIAAERVIEADQKGVFADA